MTAEPTMLLRSDSEILQDIEHRITTYPPLQNDRHAFQVTVENGCVHVIGHVQTPNTRRYLLGLLNQVSGIDCLDADFLQDDQAIRIAVAHFTPMGVQVANVHYGRVLLTGKAVAGEALEEMLDQISHLPGVVRVQTAFR